LPASLRAILAMVYSMILIFFGRVQQLCAPHERLDSDSQAPGWQLSLLTLYALQLGMSLSSPVANLCPSIDVRSLQKRGNCKQQKGVSRFPRDRKLAWTDEKRTKRHSKRGLIEFPMSANKCRRSHHLLHSRRQVRALQNAFHFCDCMRSLDSHVCLANMV
jgi:hypothetical protein